MLPHQKQDIEALIQAQPWTWARIPDDLAQQLIDRLDSWRTTDPPQQYHASVPLGHEDGYVESLVTKAGSNETTVTLGRGPAPEPPAQWRELAVTLSAVSTWANSLSEPREILPDAPFRARAKVLAVGIHPHSGIGLFSQVRAEIMDITAGQLRKGQHIVFTLGTEQAAQYVVGQEFMLSGGSPSGFTLEEVASQSESEREVIFGRARISLGMTKVEVLEQIKLSREQYQPLEDESSSEMYIRQPGDDTIRGDVWNLACPARNSRVLGGGGGMMLGIRFREGKVVELSIGPWLAG